MTDAGEWEVVVVVTHSPGDASDALSESVVMRGSEDEARRVYADTVADAHDRGYHQIRLTSGGREVELWPEATGWTS